MKLPYKIGTEVDPKVYDLNFEMSSRSAPCFYLAKIDLCTKVLIKLGKSKNASSRYKGFCRTYNVNFKVLRLIVFRAARGGRSFDYDYTKVLDWSDKFETEIIRRVKDRRFYSNSDLNSNEYYESKNLRYINHAINALIEDTKKTKESKIRTTKRITGTKIKNTIKGIVYYGYVVKFKDPYYVVKFYEDEDFNKKDKEDITELLTKTEVVRLLSGRNVRRRGEAPTICGY
jgi:hypothetical protein